MSNAFDEKNKRDFDKNTELLLSAIEKIRRNSALPTTISEVSKITGMHRNGVSNRG